MACRAGGHWPKPRAESPEELQRMAAEMWTLRLYSEDDALEQGFVQKAMDQDFICYFNQIGLIESGILYHGLYLLQAERFL